jgi:molybdenum cofactor guanylyltransferase
MLFSPTANRRNRARDIASITLGGRRILLSRAKLRRHREFDEIALREIMAISSLPDHAISDEFAPRIGRLPGAVLAGGSSNRMGAPKAFMLLAGRPLLAHVLDRLRPQTACIYLNPRDGSDRWRVFGCPLVEDAPQWRGAGPLAGVAAILGRAASQGFAWVATAPCDAPFLPLDLVRRLAEPIIFGASAAVAVGAGGLEPLFALWPVAAAGRIEAALAERRAGPSQVLQEMGAARVSFGSSAEADPFTNLNTPEELAAAKSLTRP